MKRGKSQVGGLVMGDVVLDDTCLFAHRNGEQIRFTRSERALLLVLSRNPAPPDAAQSVLDAIAPTQADASDRNVDFLVNRLRRKLGIVQGSPDSSPRNMVKATSGSRPTCRPLPLVPVQPRPADFWRSPLSSRRMNKLLAERADIVTSQMRDMIATRLGTGETVLVLGREDHSATHATRYVVKVSFQDNGDRLDCTATLREGASRRIIRAFRLDLGSATMASLIPELERASIGIIEALQHNLAEASEGLGTPTDQPLESGCARHRPACRLQPEMAGEGSASA